MNINWNTVTPVIAAGGLMLTAAGVFFATRQLRMAYKVAMHTFLYRQYELMQHHNCVHLRLTAGDWVDGSGPATPEEWNAVRRYMGLLESIQLLIRDKVLTSKLADVLYSHRVFPLAQHPLIRKQILEDKKNSSSWETFIALRDTLAKEKLYQAYGAKEKIRLELASMVSTDTAPPSSIKRES